MKRRVYFLTAVVCLISLTAISFCGFYVAKADTKLFNKSSQVILVRDGDKTTITMSNDFSGDVKDFAMVVPVPVVLERDDIRISEASLFNKLDAYSGPRLVEYFDRNPCAQEMFYEMSLDRTMTLSEVASTSVQGEKRDKDLGVTIEAKYEVEEYDILILSAKKSNGLKTWLVENGYKIPSQAEEVLEPYIKNNMKFFVVKVDVEKLEKLSGVGNVKKYIDDPEMNKARSLRPLQISFNSNKFMLPIRLGMANATGDQDMIVYAFSKKGRIECTNYRTTEIPTNKNVPLFVRNKFGKFYVDLFDKAHMKENKSAIFLEYAWNVSPRNPGVKCDPCVGPPPIFTDLQKAGVDWAITSDNQASNEVYFTRLHVRYSRETHPQDLTFHETPNKQNFQARYILTNPAGGDLSCDDGQRYLAGLIKKRATELDNLNDLTSWNTSQYKGYVQEYYDKLKDKRLLNDIEDDKGEIIPGFPSDFEDPNKWIKIGILSGMALLMLFMFIRYRAILPRFSRKFA